MPSSARCKQQHIGKCAVIRSTHPARNCALRRDVGIAPYAETNPRRNNGIAMRRAGSPDPAAGGTSILPQTLLQRAPAGAGGRDVEDAVPYKHESSVTPL